MEQDYIVQELDSVEFVRSSDGKVFSTMEDLIADTKAMEEANNSTTSGFTADDYKNCITQDDDNQFDFLFNNGSIRYFNHDNTVWFIGKDICDYLEYKDPQDAIQTHVSSTNVRHFSYGDICKGLAENIKTGESPVLESKPIGPRGALCITEQGVYELTRFSRMPKADKFYEWIHNRVLPCIRTNGIYTTPTTRALMANDNEAVYQLLSENEYIQVKDQFRLARERLQTEGNYSELEIHNTDGVTRTVIVRDPEQVTHFENLFSEAIEGRRRAEKEIRRERQHAKELDAKNDSLIRELGDAKKQLKAATTNCKSTKTRLANATTEIGRLKTILDENNIAYSNEHPKVEMCRVVKPMDDIDTILSRLIKK